MASGNLEEAAQQFYARQQHRYGNFRPYSKRFGGAKQWKQRKRNNHGNGKGRA